jgi:hypothetical protein
MGMRLENTTKTDSIYIGRRIMMMMMRKLKREGVMMAGTGEGSQWGAY